MTVALPYTTLITQGSILLQDIINISNKYNAICFVVGLPLNTDGIPSAQTNITANFIKTLKNITQLPIFFFDERYTSRAADAMLRNIGMNRNNRDKIRDQVAAQVILDGFLINIRRIANTDI